jgi:hypothetical protein
MALKGSPDVGFILYAGYDIMGLITSLEELNAAVVEQSDGMGDASDEWSAVGISKWDFSIDGFYDDTILRGIEALAGNQVLFYSLVSNTIGERCVGVNAPRTTITRGPSRDALTKALIAFKSDEGPDVGQISAAHGTVTATGPVEGTSDDWTAANDPSTDGGIGYMQCDVLDLDGGTDILIVIKDSDDDITFVDLIIFTAVTSAPDAERKIVAGNVERYTLTEHEFRGGAGGSRTCTFATGFVRN